MEFHDELCFQNKAPIAKRILFSTLHVVCDFQRYLFAEKIQDKKDSLSLTITNFKNVIYWLEQCEKSGYLFNEDLIKEAHELFEICLSQKVINRA